MLRLAWAGVRHNRGRYIATLIAILTGVAFFTATGFIADRVITSLEGDVDARYGAIDVAVVPVEDTSESTTNLAEQARIPGGVADRMTALTGVEAAAGVLTGSVAFLGDDGRPYAKDATGRLWVEDEDLEPETIQEGRAPLAAGEIAVDRGTASAHDLDVGSRVTVLTLAGRFPARVVGITRFGDSDSLDQGGTVSINRANAFDWLSSGRVEYQELYLRGRGSQSTLVSEVEPLVPDGFRAETGDEFRADKRDQIGSIGRVLKNALTGFSILALIVGGFVIYNTFSVIVAQRQRELAVLAAVGATPKQLRRSLRWEGAVVGVIGSALGVLVGIGLAFLVLAALGLFGIDLPGGGIAIRGTTVIGGILIGTVVTILSVMIPARRASRTEPIEALRDAAVETVTISRRRIIVTLGLIAVGVVAMLAGGSAAVIGLGAFVLFIGVIVAGPLIARAGTRVMTPLMARLGLEGRLAADNTGRNPRRTAATANALLIGVFLVTLVTVAGTSAKDFVVGELKKIDSADYLVQSNGGTLDPAFVAQLESVDGVKSVTAFERVPVTLDAQASLLSTGDVARMTGIADIEVASGSLDDLAPGTIAAIGDSDGKLSGKAVGDTVRVATSAGRSEELRIVALLKLTIDSSQTGSIVDAATFRRVAGDQAPTVAFVDAEDGEQTDTKEEIDALADLRPDITVTEGNALGRLIGSVFDFLINAVNGLLLMSVVIALIGIVNTLSLSILERRRELGLLRVVGMSDRRVRRMIRLESVLISLLGTVTGLVLGAFTGWALIFAINRTTDASVGTSLPAGPLLLVLVAGVGLGLLASLIPARRSTRLGVLEAIQST